MKMKLKLYNEHMQFAHIAHNIFIEFNMQIEY